VKVLKVGNSLMLPIPAPMARRLVIHEGDDEREGELVVRPKAPTRATTSPRTTRPTWHWLSGFTCRW
jgi:antitoxin component of MazEF toxin-antitoxin module